MDKVQQTLLVISEQYKVSATQLRLIRKNIDETLNHYKAIKVEAAQSRTMLERFYLLNEKYESDLERLGGINEATSLYQTFSPVSCPVCNNDLKDHSFSDSSMNYRVAVRAEMEKIIHLQKGLHKSIDAEKSRQKAKSDQLSAIQFELSDLEAEEKKATIGLQTEYKVSPNDLALKHSELSAQVNLFEDIERLKKEITELNEKKSSKTAPIIREASEPANRLASIAKNLLQNWGFQNINTVTLDIEQCDLVVNGRSRLSYGAGIRSLFLAAMSISMMIESLESNHPHLGLIVIDSPLKAYADPDSKEDNSVPISTITEGFYSWLAKYSGPGQIIILENEKIPDSLIGSSSFKPIQFGSERQGFYIS